ncbi:hypothetical protein BDV29DRAFT_88243 [Aspergillus leporis]|uniref:Uncharacterized protein n=1 Tax=Aspergillus leporis TaxID=41062 RepID=A0A5N5X6Y3_9EURO|nr:hypothetical protein BDV29DRAFT_88243 [Aspergillus leporis]
MPIFRNLRSRFSSSSSSATENRPVSNQPAHHPMDGDFVSGPKTCNTRLPNDAQPAKEYRARLEPVFSSSSQEPSYYWHNIDPPAESHRFHGSRSSYPSRLRSGRSKWTPMMRHSSHISAMNSALPGYNAVSGAVIVDWNGLPYFLSPEEEQERKSKLERAVQERMLGLSKETDFAWSQPYQGAALPRYSSRKDTQAPRPSRNK